MSADYQVYSSPIGTLYLVSEDDQLCAVGMDSNWPRIRKLFPNLSERPNRLLNQAARQLDEYFRRQRRSFELPIRMGGTAFQQRVWRALMEIPYGERRTYREQALRINSPKAVRATGRANGLNLISIIIPCHRVVGANGALTGYAGGLPAKRFLLDLENEVDCSAEMDIAPAPLYSQMS